MWQKKSFFKNVFFVILSSVRGLKDMEQESSSMEKRFSYKFLKRLLKYVDSAQEFIAHLGKRVTFETWLHSALTGALQCISTIFQHWLIFAVNPEAMATSGKTDKSPHDQEIKFFAKVWESINTWCKWITETLMSLLNFVEILVSELHSFSPGAASSRGPDF